MGDNPSFQQASELSIPSDLSLAKIKLADRVERDGIEEETS